MALRQLSTRVAPAVCRQLYSSLRTISSAQFANSASPSLIEDSEVAEAASAVDGVRQGWGKTVCRDILNVKADSGAWLWVSTQDTVFEAVKKMARANVGALLVYDPAKLDPADVSSASAVAGIFTERDYLTKVVVEGRQSQKTFVSEIMTPSVKTVAPQTTVLDAMVLMVDSNIRHVPVVERNALRGMLSMRDVVHVLVREHKEEVDNLNNYIAGTY